MNKTWLAVGGGVLVLLVVGGVVMMSNQEKVVVTEKKVGVEPTMVVKNEVVVEGELKQFVVEGSNFKFTPTEIKVKKGDRVEITFKNTAGFHDWVLDEFDAKTNQLKEGEEETIEFVADKVGTFEYYCSVGKHRAMGMVGKLIVE